MFLFKILKKIPTIHTTVSGVRTLPHPVWPPVAQRTHSIPSIFSSNPPHYLKHPFSSTKNPPQKYSTAMGSDAQSRKPSNATQTPTPTIVFAKEPKVLTILYVSAALAGLASATRGVKKEYYKRKEKADEEFYTYSRRLHDIEMEGMVNNLTERIVSMQRSIDVLSEKVVGDKKN